MRPFRLFSILLFASLVLPVALAAQSIDIRISPNDVVEEEVTLAFNATESYDSFTYSVAVEPVAVISEYPHSVEAADDGWVIAFHTPVRPGENRFSFTLVFDGMILREGSQRAFSARFSPQTPPLDVRVTLPQGAVLADTDPAVSPRPDALETDGRSVSLRWRDAEDLDIIVLYALSPSLPLLPAASAVLLGGLAVGGGLLLRRKRQRDALHETLTPDERELIDLIKGGVTTQKALVRETGWSKSKMSKVLRKLEEKRAVEKEPHLRTNRLRLSRAWR